MRDAGTVTLLPLNRHEGSYGTYQPSCRHSWHQGTGGGLGGVAEAGDQLGATVNVSTKPYMWFGDSAGRTAGARYGSVFGQS